MLSTVIKVDAVDQCLKSLRSRFVLQSDVLKMTALRDVTPCDPVAVYRSSEAPAASTIGATKQLLHHHPDDGGKKHLRNVGKLLMDYTTQQSRRRPTFIIASVRT
jgi:hypothetical protein